MKNTIVLMSSNRGVMGHTMDMLMGLTMVGAIQLHERGSPDVAFARNRALTWVCGMLRERPERDMVLMLDDDIQAPTASLQELVRRAREMQEPCSAVYGTFDKRIAAARWIERPGYWLTGLGCLAIPRARLLELEQACESFEHDGNVYTAFTSCGPENGVWVAEDFRLCRNLGGVRLLPIGVTHIKQWGINPDEATLRKLSEEGQTHEQT